MAKDAYHMFTTDHWLSDPQNVLVLRLTAPAWVTASPETPQPANSMETWGIDEVAQWLESCDMVGPAAYFRSQGVGGMDLVTFASEQHLAHDLGLTPFVAAKVLKLRNQYLAVGV